MHYTARDLFQTQTELVEAKVDMAVSASINRVVDQLNGTRHEIVTEIHDLKNSMESRLVAVETKLGMVNERDKEIRSKLVEYTFRAGWAVAAFLAMYLIFFLERFH